MHRLVVRHVVVFLAAFALLALTGRTALAKPVSPELMAKLGAYAQSFEAQLKKASYHVEGKLEVVDGDNKVTETKEVVGRVDANGGEPRFTVLRYLEDGKDKTDEAVKEAAESAAKRKRKRDSGKQLKMPVLPAEQGRYVFDETERSEDGRRVKIQFVPKDPAEDTADGSAWVDVEAGTVVSASFRMSRTSLFVHYLHFTVEFGATTSLGPAVSRVTVDGEGGILFFRRRFRGNATLSDYSVAP